MKFWAYFVAKLLVALIFLFGIWTAMEWLLPEPAPFLKHRVSRFPQDLPWTSALLAFWLLSIAVVYLVIWDQRRRCRTCLRRLRMPLVRGSWSAGSLFGPPRTESTCPYGHGTQTDPEIHLESSDKSAWVEHDDFWKELEQSSRK
jgi:hypothetical protein